MIIMGQKVPGTNIPYEGGDGMFSLFRPLIQATDGLTLGQVSKLTGLEGSTILNWVKRGFVSRPVEKKYRDRQLARILLISSLRDGMPLDRIGELMSFVNGDANDTGDDIISEEKLYDYFCSIIGRAEHAALTEGYVRELTREVTADYQPPNENAADVLTEALTIMVLAYLAGVLKREADALFQRIKEKQ